MATAFEPQTEAEHKFWYPYNGKALGVFDAQVKAIKEDAEDIAVGYPLLRDWKRKLKHIAYLNKGEIWCRYSLFLQPQEMLK